MVTCVSSVLDLYGFSRDERDTLTQSHITGVDINWAYKHANSLGYPGRGESTATATRAFFRELLAYLATGQHDVSRQIGVLPDENPKLIVPINVSGSTAFVTFRDLGHLIESIGRDALAAPGGHTKLLARNYRLYPFSTAVVYYRE